MKRIAALAVLAILGCTSSQQPAPNAAQRQFKNLQVLPKDISRDQLMATMRGFTRGLGVRCNHCHVVAQVSATTTPKEELDFPSDAKEEKRNARTMLRMVMDINRNWLVRVDPKNAGEQRVTCWTCHRGKPEPEAPPPPEQRPGA